MNWLQCVVLKFAVATVTLAKTKNYPVTLKVKLSVRASNLHVFITLYFESLYVTIKMKVFSCRAICFFIIFQTEFGIFSSLELKCSCMGEKI